MYLIPHERTLCLQGGPVSIVRQVQMLLGLQAIPKGRQCGLCKKVIYLFWNSNIINPVCHCHTHYICAYKDCFNAEFAT